MPQDPLSSLNQKKTLVIGVGNILKGDDGLGVRIAEILSQKKIPPGVKVEEAGTPGIDLLYSFGGWQKVIIVDAVQMGEKPGSWKRFSGQDVRLIASGRGLSLHETDIPSVLELAQALNLLPNEMIIYGVEPQDLSNVEKLSPPVEAIINVVADQILSEIWK